MAKRRSLKLTNGGRFVFGPKTVSIDVSLVMVDEKGLSGPGTWWLHVGRTRAALERADRVEELELDAAWDIVTREKWRRASAGEPAVESLFDPRLWQEVRRQAEHLSAGRMERRPFHSRPRRLCLDSVGGHPGEFLWLDRDTGEAAIETVVQTLDARGRPTGYTSSFRMVAAAEALQWIRTDGPRSMSESLLAKIWEAAGSPDLTG